MRDHTRPPTTRRLRRLRFGRTAAGCLLAAGAACTEAATGPGTVAGARPSRARADAAEAVDITGTWPYHEDGTLLIRDFAGAQRRDVTAFRCSSDGVYTFAQTGDAFTGAYDQVGTCVAADGTTIPNDFTGVTVTGTVRGRHLDFATVDGCTYEASVRGSARDAMGGAGRCGGLRLFGGTYRATFTAER